MATISKGLLIEVAARIVSTAIPPTERPSATHFTDELTAAT